MKPAGIPGEGPPGPADDFPRDPPVVGVPASPTLGGPSAQVLHLTYWQEVPRQTAALLKKNFILAVRNRVSTFLRLFASLFFILLIFLVNEGIKSRTASLSSFKDLPTPPRNVISGIPECSVARGLSMCYTFGYIPAPYDQYVPETTYSHLSDWIREVLPLLSLRPSSHERAANPPRFSAPARNTVLSGSCPTHTLGCHGGHSTTADRPPLQVDLSAKAAAGWCVKTDTPATRCADADCADGTSSPSCTECCAMWRTHTVSDPCNPHALANVAAVHPAGAIAFGPCAPGRASGDSGGRSF